MSRWAGLAVAALLVVGCASSPRTARRDPPPTATDAADAIADAEPRLEPIRSGGPNKPYQVLGRDYVPLTTDRPFVERGLASWYGGKFHGAPTASGEIYDMHAMTAAHPTLPLPSYARVRNPANGREVIVRVNDRGPFHPGRIVDLSHAAAKKLDLLRGVAPVELERLTFATIRSGDWRRGEPSTRAPPVPPVPTQDPSAAVAAGVQNPPAVVGRGDAVADAALLPPAVPLSASRAGLWVQLGAFRDPSGASAWQRRVADEVDWLAPQLTTFAEADVYRVLAGPYASRAAALEASARIRDRLGLSPFVIERR
ncbi:MAG: septal ring lytic transglycosylase RlpA family protein [Pseudomonadota bacterium]|nr:septal ring lytic transglycosylase RlpA family protein [Pseudomonadota bacterium]